MNTTYQKLITKSLEDNKVDNKCRYVFYENGHWNAATKFPEQADFPTVYAVEHGTVKAIVL